MRHIPYLLAGLLAVVVPGVVQAADPAAAEAKLREGLRATMIQLRDVQGQMATLQATKVEDDAKIAELTAKVDELTKQGDADRATAAKTIGDLTTKVSDTEAQVAEFKLLLEKWKQGYNKVAEVAKTKEAERAKLADQVVMLQRRVDTQQMKNDAMFKLGNEILVRYEKFGLGEALTAREPFVGITRVKFQNLIQDYSDKLVEQTIRPQQ